MKPRACLLLAALAGCSFAPKYARPPLAVPATYKDMGPWTPASPADAAPRGDWWRAYGDPALDALELKIETGNPDLASALARYDEARAVESETAAAEFPEIDLAGNAMQNRQSAGRPLRAGGPDLYANDLLQGSFSYELDLWGRVRNLVAAGKAEAQASGADLASTRLSLQAALADAYFRLRGLDAEEALLAETSADYARALHLTEVQHAGGIVSGLDLGRAETLYDDAKAQESDVSGQRALAEHEIAALVGIPAPAFTLTAAATLPAPPRIPVSTPSTLLQRRPDIAAAERRAAAANARIGVARAAFFPTISLSASGGFQDAGGGINLFNVSNSLWSLGPTLALTLFDGGRRRAAARVAVDQFDEAAAQYRSVALTAFRQVQDNLVLCNQLADEAAREAAAVQAADRTAKLSLSLYTLGAVTYLDVVTAETADLDAKRAALSIATRRLQASVALVRALGGGWGTDAASSAPRPSPPPPPPPPSHVGE